ncbi:head-tail adaptor [Hephaestia caeni]|uniref:Head-tail adaptor n=1 Tax=Hephaestia caeni TaxID=645617 RepID=A0A397NP85_9SPHN|nr:head-tail adaptor protein [Hephaestia caeni]RIA37479.1 head-tail adaptor [Hephaestia caeni]
MGVLQAGKLDRRVRIEKRTLVDDGYNEVETWAALTTVWTQFIPGGGKEAREAIGRAATTPATFRIRWQSALADMIDNGPADYRLRFPAKDDGRVFDIKKTNEIGRREGIEIVAVASDAGPT